MFKYVLGKQKNFYVSLRPTIEINFKQTATPAKLDPGRQPSPNQTIHEKNRTLLQGSGPGIVDFDVCSRLYWPELGLSGTSGNGTTITNLNYLFALVFPTLALAVLAALHRPLERVQDRSLLAVVQRVVLALAALFIFRLPTGLFQI